VNLEAIKRAIVFGVGDLRRTHGFPWFTTEDYETKGIDRALTASDAADFGDIGLSRFEGHLSNLFIPGFMKHAFIFTEDKFYKDYPSIVEATKKGVQKKLAAVPLMADYCVILSPKNVTEEDRKGACVKAESLIGEDYDSSFSFDIEKEMQFYDNRFGDAAHATTELKQGEQHFQQYDPAFSCTEVVAYSWWHKRAQLNLFRKEHMGKAAIVADDFFNNDWSIKYLHPSVTVEAAMKHGLHEQGVWMIEQYWLEQEQKK
jgi:hypothetical protein